MTLDLLNIKIFADGADLDSIVELAERPWIAGFTTNPTLMRKAGVDDYANFAREVLDVITDRPVSFEVIADEPGEMERQALEIASWGPNVNVKIPITDTKGNSCAGVVGRLSRQGVVCNVTAMFTVDQINEIVDVLDPDVPAILSVFAGRIADTGVDPVPVMQRSLEIMKRTPRAELLWASPREVLNVIQANDVGCHIITATNDILKKLQLLGKDHTDYSLETVMMFFDDAQKAGYSIADPVDAEEMMLVGRSA